jgi:spoIIIJ-associated protein|tara:strand:+ start:1165 stop:1806 length:642 start_codon:yes stop_codon:yes gene_type:complete
MKVVETTAKTIEEAIDIALVELNASREEVEIKVINRGKTGLLGFGNEQAKVKVEKVSDVPENIQHAYEVLRNFLEYLDSPMKITTKILENGKVSDSLITLDGEDAALLIGRRGETLRSLQYIVNLIIQKKVDNKDDLISLDVEGYIEKKFNNLSQLARKMEKTVIRNGKSISMEPMSAYERRYIHRFFTDSKKIITESEDFGRNRHVVLKPKK